jgi:hypothetical protein
MDCFYPLQESILIDGGLYVPKHERDQWKSLAQMLLCHLDACWSGSCDFLGGFFSHTGTTIF